MVHGGIGACNGPTMEIRVRAGILTARFAWSDALAETIEVVFGRDNPPGVDGEIPNIEEALKPLLLNERDLKEYSEALAATIYANMTDRRIGTRGVRMDSTLAPLGSIRHIIHTLDTTGAATTQLSLREDLIRLDPFGLLPDDVRRVILREVF